MRVARQCPVRRLLLLMVWFLAAGVSSTLAQVVSGEMTGLVRDQAGAAVPGATITITSVETNRQRIVSSNGEAIYTAPSLAPGDSRVDAGSQGFRPVRP